MIGCAKSRLVGAYRQPGPVLRTPEGVKPVFVSTGHRVSLTTAREWLLRLSPRYRFAEPLRAARRLSVQSGLRNSRP